MFLGCRLGRRLRMLFGGSIGRRGWTKDLTAPRRLGPRERREEPGRLSVLRVRSLRGSKFISVQRLSGRGRHSGCGRRGEVASVFGNEAGRRNECGVALVPLRILLVLLANLHRRSS